MNPEEAKAYILKHVSVTRQKIAIAQAFVLANFEPDSSKLIGAFLNSVEAEMPREILLHPTRDPLPALDAAAAAISWKLAACEAIWGLISAAVLFPASSDLRGEIGTLAWTTVIPGSGGTSSGFSLDEISIRVPVRVAKSRSVDLKSEQPLTSPDLYLKEVNLADLHLEIEAALREAVKAFRHGLYLACLAMLGKAMEVAWIELGLGLAKAVEDASASNSEKLRKQMEDPFVGIARKINVVTQAYSDKDAFGAIAKASGVTLQDLRNCVVWADCVRASRNSLHYGAEPSMSNTYEKVAALLIGAVPHIKTIAKVTEAALSEPDRSRHP